MKAVATLAQEITQACPTGSVPDAGYGLLFDASTLVARTTEACLGEAATLAARSFGGPHGAVLAVASEDDRKCLTRAYKEGTRIVEKNFKVASDCIRKGHRGASCDATRVAIKTLGIQTKGAAKVERYCATALFSRVGLEASTFASRAAAQARCAVATAHGDTSTVALDCGPRGAVPVPARATNVQIVLNSSTWGTLRRRRPVRVPASTRARGQPGRACTRPDARRRCVPVGTRAATTPALFDALGDPMPNAGALSTSSATNPFADWTQVFLPYCTQDVHIGGGVTQACPEMTVHRYGAPNVRAAMRYVRDVIWAELDATDPDGFRPDRMTVLTARLAAAMRCRVFKRCHRCA